MKVISFLRGSLSALVLSSLLGCAVHSPTSFKENRPALIPEEFFVGKTRGTGIFFDRFDGVQATFVVDLDGTWDGKVLTLDENLHFGDGENQHRIYKLTKQSEHVYDATCDDIKGKSTLTAYGNAFEWTYDLKQTYQGKTATLHYDDWMYLQPDGIVLDHSMASKFGLRIGAIFMSLEKQKL